MLCSSFTLIDMCKLIICALVISALRKSFRFLSESELSVQQCANKNRNAKYRNYTSGVQCVRHDLHYLEKPTPPYYDNSIYIFIVFENDEY